MVATISKGAVAQYYLRRTEYYLGGNEPAGQFIGSTGSHQSRFEFVTSLYDETLATPGQTLVFRGRNRQQTISRERLTLDMTHS